MSFQVPIIRCIVLFYFWANIRHQLGLPVSAFKVKLCWHSQNLGIVFNWDGVSLQSVIYYYPPPLVLHNVAQPFCLSIPLDGVLSFLSTKA